MPADDSAARGPIPLGPIGRYVILNLTELRKQRGLTYTQLAERLDRLGRPIPTLGLSRIEKGNRRVDVDDLVALALALGVNPSALLLPRPHVGTGDDVIELAPGRRATARDAWDWADGQIPIPRPDDVGPELADFENHARPVWLHRGVIRASEIPEMRRRLEEQLQRLEFLASAPPFAEPVVAAIVTSDLGVLVGRRLDGRPPWGFITGEVEPGELPEDAAVREVKEETGLEVRAGRLIGERNPHPATGRHMIYMAAEPTRGTDIFVGDEAELAEVRWLGLAEADQLLPGMFGPVREHLAAELGEA